MPVGIYTRSEGHKSKLRKILKNTQFTKDCIPWNKGLKGYHPAGIGFLEGHIPWNKNLRVQLNTGKTHFPKGKNHPHWKGGITKLTERIRACSRYIKWRALVFKRDGWTCQSCISRGYKVELQVHHIKPIKEILKKIYIKGLEIDDLYFLALSLDELFDVSNGVTLCKSCHNLLTKKQGEIR